MAKKKLNNITVRQVFNEIIWPKRGMLLMGLILILLKSAATIIPPKATQYLIDDVVVKGDIEELKYIVGAIVFAIVIQASTSFILTRVLSVQAQKLIATLRVQVQKKILSLPVNFFDSQKSGALVSRIMTDVEGVRNLVGTGFVQLIGGSITAIAVLIILIDMNAKLTALIVLPIILFGVIAMRAFKILRPEFRKRGKLNAEVTGRLTETLNGIRVIKGFGAEKQEIKVFDDGVNSLYQVIKKTLTATAVVSSSATFLLAGVATTSILGVGGYYIIQGEMTSGQLFAFIAYLAVVVAPLLQMSNIGSQITEAFAGLDRTEEIMQTASEEDDDARTVALEKIEGNVKFNNVSFAYEDENDVIKGINFDAPAGSVTALVGSSGSGKSTIAGLVATFLNPRDGKITVDGTDLSTVQLRSFRRKLGVVLQDDFLFEGTIRENILFPRPEATEEQLQAAVKAAYVNEFTDRFEEGLNTVIGERGVKLSGGQRQRIAIARAVLADPRILILDEATSNLDTESESFIQASLNELMKGRTTFVIAHRLSTIKKADQILVIEKGEIAERGTHDELITKEGRYYQLYTYQARI
ncbi:ABC transporter ATP-binding protein [Roseivirga pacifica]|uniref:ABC transporter ATP-binding protein n=1 Tax=Roseivirga pacifica TaxID=1267423 RepID=UPI002094CFC2|nr:ABC transporter ATP-binding protein [Roseivirga pacifica]MCO6367507.1 ATP-binding cassette domain-containing protein [Roseivirga pacifica]MCO6369962.1 ATP-binding cassette domain-containing protein [Roseivirga pacifica]MCO6375163.1 ATP-binding cassette domain-containing protein [Roseivirga pacifica]MCO6380422.1 ATP-binding cassette domain-containing protein [Roseivirga pacifica]